MARIAVIGGGIIGLSCAFHLRDDGHDVTVFDRDPDGDKCSWGNAGGVAVTEVASASVPGLLWRAPKFLLDPLGPLALRPAHLPGMLPWLYHFARASRAAEVGRIVEAMAALLGRVYDDLCPMLAALGLSDDLRRTGALTVYRSAAALRADAAEWALKRRHGIACEEIGGAEARRLEPALGASIQAAVVNPTWSNVADPKTIWAALRAAARVEARDIADPAALNADTVVVAAGGMVGAAGDDDRRSRASLESERGYTMTITDPGISLGRQIVFAERKFVASPLAMGLRIGGAAEFAGLSAPANYRRSRTLAKLATSYLPGLRTEGGVAWMGQRPTTPDTLPVLGRSPRRPDILYAFGHGHLGLTLAATTGRLIADLIAGRKTPDLAPYSIARFSRG